MADDYMKLTLLDITIDDEAFYLFDGKGTFTYDGHVYIGVPYPAAAATSEESLEPVPAVFDMSLSGVDLSILALAAKDNFQYGDVKVKVVTLNYPELTVRGEFTMFEGYLSHLSVDHSYRTQEGTLAVSCFTELANQNLAAALRYTDQSQKVRDPTDTAFSRLPEQVDREVIWGRGEIRGRG